MKKLYKNIENIFGGLMILMMIIFLSIQVISRYVFNSPTTWTEELSKLAFILSVFFGMIGAWPRNEHLALSILTENVGKKAKCYLRLVVDIITITFCTVIVPAMIRLAMSMKASGMALAVTQWPKWIFYVLMPCCFILMSWRIVEEIISIIKSIRNHTYEFLSDEAYHSLGDESEMIVDFEAVDVLSSKSEGKEE